MLQARSDVDFALEPGGADFTCRLRRQELDDDLAIERRFGGEKQPAHPTG